MSDDPTDKQQGNQEWLKKQVTAASDQMANPHPYGNVVPFTGDTTLPLSAGVILEAAREKGLSDALVIGLENDGSLYFSSTTSDAGGVLLLLEKAKKVILED